MVSGATAPVPAPSIEEMVLIVDPDRLARRRVSHHLASHGFRVTEVAAVGEIEQRVFDVAPGLIVVNFDPQPRDGLEVLRRLRGWSKTPVIVLSDRRQEIDKVAALDAGADDYVTIPFADLELLARVRSALRRARGQETPVAEPAIVVGPLRIDRSAQEVTLAGNVLSVTRLELRLLTALAHNAGRVLTCEQLALAAWGPSAADQPRHVRVYIARIRQLIEVDPARPSWLITKLRVGYCLRKEPEPDGVT